MNNVIPDAARPIESAGSDNRNPRAMTPEKLQAILAAAQRLRDDPLFEDWVRAVEEFRRENNTVPDPD
jgi:hypothetical protein